jgi:hypothetical protein
VVALLKPLQGSEVLAAAVPEESIALCEVEFLDATVLLHRHLP